MIRAALDEVLRAAACAPGGEVEFSGADPVLPLRYRVGTAAAAALAATGVSASHLWQLRTGRTQRVAVDVRAATVSLRGATYLRIDGKPPASPWAPMSGFYPARQGWVSIHCNFPGHRDAALRVLGTAAERPLAEKASAGWDGEALEEAIHAAGGCAGFVRPPEQWASHPQAAAVASHPLLEIVRIGAAPPEPLPRGERPLAGIRVLDLTRVLAGPTGARTLAEHGADVLKITASHLADSGQVDLDTGIGKLSARLDLRQAADGDRLRGLIRDGDVFSQSFRPGALAARGLAPEALAALRPGIVCVSLSAWGSTGPWRNRRGFDSIVQAVSGMAHACGRDGKPRLLPLSAIDYVAGYLMAFGAMVALERRAREGGSWLVRVALARVGRWITDRGEEPADKYLSLPADLPEAELAPLMMEMEAPDGRLRFLRPVVQLSETAPRWTRPPVPLGYHAASWPARQVS
ncbi:MAG: CoA transferase [Betaproteobacteria bacterium]